MSIKLLVTIRIHNDNIEDELYNAWNDQGTLDVLRDDIRSAVIDTCHFLDISVAAHDVRSPHIEKYVPQGIDTSRLYRLMKEYIEELPADEGEDIHDSYRGHASFQLYPFLDWLKRRQGEE